MRILILGIIIYFSKGLFFKLGSHWFEELKDREGFEERASILRNNFWKSFFLSLFVIGVVTLYLVQAGHAVIDKTFCLRLVAIIIALTASLGRGGWNIQSYKGKTVIERIDRGMFVLSQLGATVVLLFALTLK
jgi:hypothetical protein